MKKTLFLVCALSSCASHKLKEPKVTRVQLDTVPQIPLANNKESKIPMGGFSGLDVLSANESAGEYILLTHTDRGPNLEQIKVKGQKMPSRPFVEKDFVPSLVQLKFNLKKMTLEFVNLKKLTRKGKAMSGLPNSKKFDEIPISVKGKKLNYNSWGLDLEGLQIDADKSLWLCDEYGPSIVHFSSEGELLSRWIPKDQPDRGGEPLLPKMFGERRVNRGFEGLALTGSTLYAFLQSPLEKGGATLPVLALQVPDGGEQKIYDYPLENLEAEKIGDAVGLADGSLLVLEQDSVVGPKSVKNVYRVWFEGDKVRKTLVLDLNKAGIIEHEKMEGMTLVGPRHLLLMTDNDFGQVNADAKSELIVVELAENLPVRKF